MAVSYTHLDVYKRQVFGCSASGIFTEDDWVLDAPAAAAMVFSGSVSLQLAKLNRCQQALLTLSAPNAINSTWLNDGNTRYGGVSGDAVGQGPFSVWQNGKGDSTGRVEAFFSGVQLASRASHGLKLLTKAKKIQKTNNFDVELLDNKPPFAALQKAWETYTKSQEPVPLHLVIALYANSAEAINRGEFNQTHLISFDAVSYTHLDVYKRQVLLMNMCVPLIDAHTQPRVFGHEK